jgi:large subunit ribosomal protein LX
MSNEKAVKVFRISGSFKQRREITSFSREFLALTEENAKDKLFSMIGSKNRIKRGQIKIHSIETVPFADVTDPLIDKIIKSDFKIPFEE